MRAIAASFRCFRLPVGERRVQMVGLVAVTVARSSQQAFVGTGTDDRDAVLASRAAMALAVTKPWSARAGGGRAGTMREMSSGLLRDAELAVQLHARDALETGGEQVEGAGAQV